MKKPGKQPKAPNYVEQLVKDAGGKIEEVSGPLPDGSGFCTASFPLPKNHWLTAEGHNEPPMTFQMGTDNPERKEWEKKIKEAAKRIKDNLNNHNLKYNQGYYFRNIS